MEVRRARPEELQACADVYVRAGRHRFTWVDPAEFHIGKLLGWIEEGEEVYLAADDGRIIGMMTFWRPDNYVHNLFVDPGAQGRGAGSALLALAERIADGPVWLKCDGNNAAARAFYERRGLVVTGEGARDNGETWWAMRRPDPRPGATP